MGFFSKISSWLGAKPSEQAPETEVQAVQEPAEATPGSLAEGPAASTDSSTAQTVAPHLVSQDWQKDLTLALRQAEPKLSVWLGIVLQDVKAAGPELWQRLHFLFLCLEAPKAEADDFIPRFEKWLANMGYQEVEEFRSELQYRLALALDLEDEEDERSRLFLKLSEGLAKTREQIAARIDGCSPRTADGRRFLGGARRNPHHGRRGLRTGREALGPAEKPRPQGGSDRSAGFKDILREELAQIFRCPKTSRPSIRPKW